ncbi:hypothetical protein VKI21_02905 [Cyanobacterium aponinum UTEX 3222]|uniref:Spore coat protein U domain-containing protein n=1 Tax=Cyanobacterium aponinum AL20115 TaxID=3090662 RepID=A0AAF1C2B2_9CHRO|nr:hypothetical protein [Cyanobacterium aponinum]WPF88493.1 hypothetical protein SAY89_17135 [Cyanobacterium aponinum AL20115]WRL42656.1 hypothetical protein VKI21_02905 [Cyanobacterium aponinum UTEX 3222]
MRISKSLTIYFLLSFIGFGFIFAKSSQAQTAIFNFQTTIGGECSFTNIQGGSLQLSGDRKTFTSDNPATATLTCNRTSLDITLNPPEVSTNSAPFIIASSWATATYQENSPGNSPQPGNIITLTATNGSPASKTYGNNRRMEGSRDLTVNMSVTSDNEVSAGLYRFNVRFSATPK